MTSVTIPLMGMPSMYACNLAKGIQKTAVRPVSPSFASQVQWWPTSAACKDQGSGNHGQLHGYCRQQGVVAAACATAEAVTCTVTRWWPRRWCWIWWQHTGLLLQSRWLGWCHSWHCLPIVITAVAPSGLLVDDPGLNWTWNWFFSTLQTADEGLW